MLALWGKWAEMSEGKIATILIVVVMVILLLVVVQSWAKILGDLPGAVTDEEYTASCAWSCSQLDYENHQMFRKCKMCTPSCFCWNDGDNLRFEPWR